MVTLFALLKAFETSLLIEKYCFFMIIHPTHMNLALLDWGNDEKCRAK